MEIKYTTTPDYFRAALTADAHVWDIFGHTNTMGPVLTFAQMVDCHSDTTHGHAQIVTRGEPS